MTSAARHLVRSSVGAFALAVTAAACVAQGTASAPASAEGTVQVASAETPCKSAVSQSRMLCVSGAMCVRELSSILRSCASHGRAACNSAREALLASCGGQTDWYGTDDCRGALREVEAHCGP